MFSILNKRQRTEEDRHVDLFGLKKQVCVKKRAFWKHSGGSKDCAVFICFCTE